MNKEIKRYILFLFVIVLFTFIKVNAASALKPWYPHSCRYNSTPDFCPPDSKERYYYKLPGVSGNRRFDLIGVYAVNNNSKDMQAYCIEPGVKIGDGYNNATIKNLNDYPKFDYNQKKNISKIFTYGENIPMPKGWNNTHPSKEQIYKTYATQGLIWEVVTGIRKNFNHYNPYETSVPKDSFYYRISNSDPNGGSYIYPYYMEIIDKIYYTLERDEYIGDFKKSLNYAKTIPLTCNDNNCYYETQISTIYGPFFNYWEIIDNGGMDVKITNNGYSIKISTNDIIEKNNPRLIKIRTKGNSGESIAYINQNLQDLTSVGGMSQEAYLKVYTPKYQLKVIKKSKSEEASLNNIPIEGVKYELYSDSVCKNKIATLTTDSSGEATYKELSKPGTYYVKEIYAPSEYVMDSTPYSIDVTGYDLADSNSFGTKTFYNNVKEFVLEKNVPDENDNLVLLKNEYKDNGYYGPEFEMLDGENKLYFTEIKPGFYKPTNKSNKNATTKLRTNNGKFKIYSLPKCKYKISETKAPDGLTLYNNPIKDVNVCVSNAKITFTNGFTGLEFQKKDEDGKLISGGKFTLQKKINNVYKDVLLKKKKPGYYEYDSNLKDDSKDATYILETTNDEANGNIGRLFIKKLSPGEYRIIEKEAPEGYDPIKDSDSKAIVNVKDSAKEYYLVEMVNQKHNQSGSNASAELIVTITTGRKILNYTLIVGCLVIILIIIILLRKKYKK